MEKRKTCGDCPHVKDKRVGSTVFYSCGLEARMVPQKACKREAVFFNVPTWCPLPSHEVQKQYEKQPPEEWITVTHVS